MEPLNLAICDDLPEERKALLALLEQAPIATNCTQFGSSEELLEAFRPGKFDLLLMDIYMDGMTGVEAVQKIREMDDAIPIAFTTTSTEHTLESYRLSVLKYLEKPVRQKDINDLLHLVKLQRDSAPRLAIRQNGETQRLPLSELFYLEQKGHHVMLSRKGGSVLQLYGKLSDLLPQLEGQPFFCPHKSYCVNLAFVRGINEEYQSYELADGKMVPISRSNRAKAKRAWEDFLFARTRGDG